MPTTTASRPTGRDARPATPIRACPGAIALGALAALLASCGGGDDQARTAFAARGDRVCSAVRAQARAIAPVPDTAPASAQAAYLRRATPIARSEVTRLQALTPPADDAKAVHSYLLAQLDQIALIERAAAALAAGNAAGAGADFQAANALAPHLRTLAAQAGFRVCGAEFS